ncbi:hypothetical protein HZS_7026 [Henneguya salminicola]|nr:hypothetical protein HZS_7026 [Henneguya salminicola]
MLALQLIAEVTFRPLTSFYLDLKKTPPDGIYKAVCQKITSLYLIVSQSENRDVPFLFVKNI